MDSLPICIPNPILPPDFAPVDTKEVKARLAFDLLASLGGVEIPDHLAVMRDKYWGRQGVDLSVSFLDNPSQEIRNKILLYANGWGKKANVKFRETKGLGQVRITREKGGGYWSYLGRDILGIPARLPTMNLDSFTMSTPDREWSRVVPHEFGHTLGFPHEHTRKEIVSRIDPQKAYAMFRQSSGWSKQMVNDQVLTALNEQSLIATKHARPDSIMCYSLPASIMRDGKAVEGGSEISLVDHDLCRKIYPMPL